MHVLARVLSMNFFEFYFHFGLPFFSTDQKNCKGQQFQLARNSEFDGKVEQKKGNIWQYIIRKVIRNKDDLFNQIDFQGVMSRTYEENS